MMPMNTIRQLPAGLLENPTLIDEHACCLILSRDPEDLKLGIPVVQDLRDPRDLLWEDEPMLAGIFIHLQPSTLMDMMPLMNTALEFERAPVIVWIPRGLAGEDLVTRAHGVRIKAYDPTTYRTEFASDLLKAMDVERLDEPEMPGIYVNDHPEILDDELVLCLGDRYVVYPLVEPPFAAELSDLGPHASRTVSKIASMNDSTTLAQSGSTCYSVTVEDVVTNGDRVQRARVSATDIKGHLHHV